MGNHEITCDICKNDPSITCNGACDVVEERLTGRNASRDARIREERARRVGEAVIAILDADQFGVDALMDGDTTPLYEAGAVDALLQGIAAALRGAS